MLLVALQLLTFFIAFFHIQYNRPLQHYQSAGDSSSHSFSASSKRSRDDIDDVPADEIAEETTDTAVGRINQPA